MSDETIFAAALEKADPAERTVFLDRACPDPAARERIDRLLAAHDQAGAFMQRPAVAPEGFPTMTQAPDGDGSAEPDDALTFLTPSARPDALGRIGHYDVLQVLGKGAFGIVFRAFDDVLQRVVAVKVMAPLLAATSPARKRFLREARSSAQVRHENVVQVYDVGEQPIPFIVMEFIPGETLQQRLNRVGPVDAAEVVRVGRQIAEGLAAAHASDLIHRDIKPGNVLIEGGQHRVKITDFGLARAADDASISQSGIIAGTPMYMAPEQALGQKLDQRADLFSLGSVLYQMAAGRPPFRATGTVAVLKRVAEDTPRDIREITPETPAWLCDIIAKLHAKNPDDRYQSAREVADVLADCEAQLKASNKLMDYSRIPRGPRPARRPRQWRFASAVAAVVLFMLAGAWAGPPLLNYAGNRGVLEILPGDGLTSVIVLRNDEGVLDGNKLHAPVTDWLGMKQQQTLTLPPGRYQLNVGTWPAGTVVTQWEVTDSGLFGRNRSVVPVVQTSAIVTVDRGRRVTLRPVVRPAPAPTPAAAGVTPPAFTNSIGMEFVRVPKGKSWLGGGKDRLGDKEVDIPADFYLGKYEVTQEDWEKVMGENPSHFSRTGAGKDAVKDISDADLKRFPVESVTWDDCQVFVAKLNEREKETGWTYRLPTEQEWEYACRGGPMADRADSAYDFYLGRPTNVLSPGQVNCNKEVSRTCRVGSYTANRLGLFDMHGNVWEWCADATGATDEGPHRIHLGGGWNGAPWRSGAANLKSDPPSRRANNLGLRLARFPTGATPAVKTPADPKGWVVLKPGEMKSEGGATLKLQDDDSVLVSGTLPDKDRYTLTIRDVPAKVHSLRLEVLPHPSLPMNGPGRSADGPFVLSGVKTELIPPGKSDPPVALKLVRAWADHSTGDDATPPHAIDADDNTGWAAEFDKWHFLVVELAEPVAVPAGGTLRVTLEFQHDVVQRQLGCFRLSAAPVAQPRPKE